MKFVDIPEELRSVLGEQEKGTRMYFKAGPQEEAGAWADAVFEVVGPAVTRGGVCLYVPVGRAAVHKRLREGRLTGFFYEITHRKRTLFGGSKDVRELDVALIPVSECREWAEELKAIALARGLVTETEIKGDLPDWQGDLLYWRTRQTRRKASEAGKSRRDKGEQRNA